MRFGTGPHRPCCAAQLSAIDELNLLREFGEGSTIVATRAEYLVAAIQALRLTHLTVHRSAGSYVRRLHVAGG